MKMNKEKSLEIVRKTCEECYDCPLGETRNKLVFSEGSPNSKIMLIGEAPGAQEDETGIPFVGRAGKLLDQILLSQNITRENDIYICNTVKCRPPQNRVPTDAEKAECRKYLNSQMDIIKPAIIILCGATAVKSMMKVKLGITKIRGQWFEGPHGAKMMPIFHPSYLLRNPSEKEGTPKWLMMQDIKEIRRVYDSL